MRPRVVGTGWNQRPDPSQCNVGNEHPSCYVFLHCMLNIWTGLEPVHGTTGVTSKGKGISDIYKQCNSDIILF